MGYVRERLPRNRTDIGIRASRNQSLAGQATHLLKMPIGNGWPARAHTMGKVKSALSVPAQGRQSRKPCVHSLF